ncbi:MFS transporter [Sphingomonas koreensis]|nr:MFS transporter [Sphingomonas koreensis]
MSRLNIFTVVVASLAGLLFGFDTAVISGITSALRTVFQLSEAGLGLTVAIALLGTCIGALVSGFVGNKLGGRDTLKIVGLLFALASIGCAVAPNVYIFGFSRLMLGIAVGGASVLAPVYISEIVAPRRRGFMVGLFQFNIVFGILLAYLSNFIVAQLVAGDAQWRWKVGVAAVPSLFFLVMLFFIPQSARWLASKGRMAQAEESLRRVGATETLADITAPEEGHGHLSWRLHRKPIVFAMLLAFFNQFTGINAILYYLNDIFAAAGFGNVSGDLQAVVVGLANLLATLVGMTFIDRLGRKTLLVTGSLIMSIALAAVAFVMGSGHGTGYLLALLVIYILAFAFSQGAVIWVYMSEIFPNSVRATGQSVGSSTHWIINFAITLLFPIIAAHARALPFVVFAIVTLASVFVVGRLFPETKGSSLENLAGKFQSH